MGRQIVVDEDNLVREYFNKAYSKEFYAEKRLEDIFGYAKVVYLEKCGKEGNTITPWDDFSSAHLEKRLKEEIAEWEESKKQKELLDIINLAAFMYLAKIREFAEK